MDFVKYNDRTILKGRAARIFIGILFAAAIFCTIQMGVFLLGCIASFGRLG